MRLGLSFNFCIVNLRDLKYCLIKSFKTMKMFLPIGVVYISNRYTRRRSRVDELIIA